MLCRLPHLRASKWYRVYSSLFCSVTIRYDQTSGFRWSVYLNCSGIWKYNQTIYLCLCLCLCLYLYISKGYSSEAPFSVPTYCTRNGILKHPAWDPGEAAWSRAEQNNHAVLASHSSDILLLCRSLLLWYPAIPSLRSLTPIKGWWAWEREDRKPCSSVVTTSTCMAKYLRLSSLCHLGWCLGQFSALLCVPILAHPFTGGSWSL